VKKFTSEDRYARKKQKGQYFYSYLCALVRCRLKIHSSTFMGGKSVKQISSLQRNNLALKRNIFVVLCPGRKFMLKAA
jgi:hypothetical protein